LLKLTPAQKLRGDGGAGGAARQKPEKNHRRTAGAYAENALESASRKPRKSARCAKKRKHARRHHKNENTRYDLASAKRKRRKGCLCRALRLGKRKKDGEGTHRRKKKLQNVLLFCHYPHTLSHKNRYARRAGNIP
jgi:hypothetical protein